MTCRWLAMAPSALGHPRLPSLQGPFPSGSLPYCSCFPNDVWWGVITLVSYLQSLSGCQKKKRGAGGRERTRILFLVALPPVTLEFGKGGKELCCSPSVLEQRDSQDLRGQNEYLL